LVICGADDSLVSTGDAEELKQGIKGAVLKTLPGGHLVNVEYPFEFMEQVEGFLLTAGNGTA
jgi:pimeloyl-ACP methyl ester carboxylesterase